ncbi:MAG: rhodanese-like domain-containing protein [Lachnospiraceae bacterium]|nr:rhodanese-like domain-containing protein [Lachnospiraceae bacterium]
MEEQNTQLYEFLERLGKPGCIFIDLRTPQEFREGHLAGAVNIPYDDLAKKKSRLRKQDQLFLYCDRGNVSLMAYRDLKRDGFQVTNLWGGVYALEKAFGSMDQKFVDMVWKKN